MDGLSLSGLIHLLLHGYRHWRNTGHADRPPVSTEGPFLIVNLVRDVYLYFRSSFHALRPWVAA
jgi:hypothetical protein